MNFFTRLDFFMSKVDLIETNTFESIGEAYLAVSLFRIYIHLTILYDAVIYLI